MLLGNGTIHFGYISSVHSPVLRHPLISCARLTISCLCIHVPKYCNRTLNLCLEEGKKERRKEERKVEGHTEKGVLNKPEKNSEINVSHVITTQIYLVNMGQ